MNFLKKTASALFPVGSADPGLEQFSLHSEVLGRDYLIDAYLPGGHAKNRDGKYPFVLFNDGQDLPRMDFQRILQKLMAGGQWQPHLIFGVHCNERRIREYGTARQADYKGRGDLASDYSRFILQELLPHLRLRFPLSDRSEETAIAGFSLGGLSAFDIAWAHPEVFGEVGVFSGSFWWRSHEVRPEDPDADRIMHDVVEKSDLIDPHQRFWFQCGALDETDDRNHNGVIDAIDDTLDLIKALRSKGVPDYNIRYLELPEGRHEPGTWGQAMPDFLRWV
jgi:enterochelin esterase-like enzyme